MVGIGRGYRELRRAWLQPECPHPFPHHTFADLIPFVHKEPVETHAPITWVVVEEVVVDPSGQSLVPTSPVRLLPGLPFDRLIITGGRDP